MDRLTFDGSCDPNPGGRLGYGWTITWADGRTQEGRGERQRNPANTVNVGEYLGLINGLREYAAAGGTGPLLISGDSQLIIGQVQGITKTKQPHLLQLRDEAQHLIRTLSGGARLEWHRREHNSAADALARRPGEVDVPQPAHRTYAPGVDAQTTAVAPEVRAAIVRLNAHAAPGFGEFARLRTGGADAFSALKLPQLTQQVGPAIAETVAAAFPDSAQQQAAALRWIRRGLAVELAIRKGQVDAELAKRAGGSRGRP